MAIDLLSAFKKQQQPQAPQMSSPLVGMNTPQGVKYVSMPSTPIGVTAKSPTTSMSAPQTTLPKAQANPVYTPPPAAPKTTEPTQPQTPQAPAAPTFSGILGQLVNRAGSPPQQAQNHTQQGAAYGAGSIPIAAQARDIAQQFGQQYAKVGEAGAKFRAGQLTTGTTPVAEGNAAVTAQSTAAQQAALAQGQQAALQGINQQLAGQQQASSAANAAAGQEYTGYGQQLGALNNAAGLAQPNVGGIGQVPYSPIDLAQGAPLGSTQPGGVAAAGNLLGQFAGAQAAGAAPGSVQAQQIAQVEGYKSALQQGQNLQAQLSDLITQFGLNPNDINGVNRGLQAIARNVSSPQYKILQNYINDIANTYAQVLTPPNGSATDTTRSIAASMLDATASGKSILQTMQSLDEAAKAKIAGVPTIGGGSTGNTNFGGGTTVQTSAGPVNTNW